MEEAFWRFKPNQPSKIGGLIIHEFKGPEGKSQRYSDKLKKKNFRAWRFIMTNFLMGKGQWKYIKGENANALQLSDRNQTTEQRKEYEEWNQGAQKVMYWLSVSIQDSMIGHIQDAKTWKESWNSLVTLYETNTKAWKLQLKAKLHTLEKKGMLVFSAPDAFPSNSSNSNPWSGRLHGNFGPKKSSNTSKQGKEKLSTGSKTSISFEDIDGGSSGSKKSLDEELGLPSVKIPGVRKAHADDTRRSDPRPRRCGRMQNPVQ
ncbi:hypothetical protein KP509_31G029700 [Ceratopteris richardii]|uniref:DUF4219 domain-containing protein n=1 Tax=Ceratopteris richardii TaxID=49495 RepID=A0A8T2QYQ2_CERRI|nr:hypothetical protein KP509_31G029700 [Ceratopteris richardii]